MARYFFHVEDGRSHIDDVGVDLPTLEEAKCEAVRYAGQLICDHANEFWDAGEWLLRVTDERDLTLFTLTMIGSDAPVIQYFSQPPLPAS